MRSVRSALAFLVLTTVAAAQTAPPVILVHGLNSNEATWNASVQRLESLGYGTPYTYHVDLNATASTEALGDVVGPVLSTYAETASGTTDLPLDRSIPERASTTDSRLFLANFDGWSDATTLHVHQPRRASGQSESNCSAIAKQGLGLQRVITDVLAWTGADRVTLVGHSMGGLAIREYLQRRTDTGAPRWWTDPTDTVAGHRVAAVVTTGTPHQGSNIPDFGLVCPASEALRDLRFSYAAGDAGRYLYGGTEADLTGWDNRDIDANGLETDTAIGLNDGDPSSTVSADNPAIPLPRNVSYTYVFSAVDGVVPTDRQVVRSQSADGSIVIEPAGAARTYRRDVPHLFQPGDADTIALVLRDAVFTPAEALSPETRTAAVLLGNPVRESATVRLTLSQPQRVRLDAIDVLGRVVSTRSAEARTGTQDLRLDLRGVAAGAYILRVSGAGSAEALPFTVVR